MYQQLATTVNALQNCHRVGRVASNDEWAARHEERIKQIMDTAPHGSGIDSGTKLLMEKCTPNRLVFQADYHHMNDGGYYDGWTEHRITVEGSLMFGFTLKIGGRDRNQIKDYLADTYESWLNSPALEFKS